MVLRAEKEKCERREFCIAGGKEAMELTLKGEMVSSKAHVPEERSEHSVMQQTRL